MELLSILSTIILVATISTFILSIGAYILYKIRSRREETPIRNAVGPTHAELVTVSAPADIVKIREQSAKSNIVEPLPDEFDQEISRTNKRVEESAERVKREKVSSRYVKYSADDRSSSDKDRTQGDLQWR